MGVTHGDLRAENIVLDENLECKIIDVVHGWGFMFGWNPWTLGHLLARSDFVEIVTDGNAPAESHIPEFDASILNNDATLKMADITRKCLSDNLEDQPTGAMVLNELGGFNICGCMNNQIPVANGIIDSINLSFVFMPKEVLKSMNVRTA